MNFDDWSFWMTVFSTACWPVCFWWMYCISAKQNSVLSELREQSERIERLSREEHDLIKEVHPQIGEMAEKVEELAAEKQR
jgi:hypothetical protein